ncbi:MAG: dihydroxyacetone kinase subunit DhaL [Lachnospiraceae bacterium]|nr:dihydroxyacetone kinase subunit DhaL [Lachnospiraceae bacterium]
MTDSKKVIEILKAIGDKIQEQKEFLTELDNVIGDGDHGINMARGFGEVEKKLPTLDGKDVGTILKTTGMTLVSTVGGASGPLYGTAFMKAGMAGAGKNEIEMTDFLKMLDDATEGIKMRGKATTGEKTMLDAIVPSIDAMKAEYEASKDAKKALAAGVKAAKEGVEYTKTIAATKGRACYVGERSIGHQDPGATSYTMMLTVISEMI